jgi:hypothetical protein
MIDRINKIRIFQTNYNTSFTHFSSRLFWVMLALRVAQSIYLTQRDRERRAKK